MVNFQMWGEGRWIGGIGTGRSDNHVGHMSIPVECGVNRALVRSTTHAGDITLSVYAEGVRPAYLTLKTKRLDKEKDLPMLTLKPSLVRGETPASPSYIDTKRSANIASVRAGSAVADAAKSYDDNELSEWKSDGERDKAWITYRLDRKAKVDEVVLKLTGWRQKCYPLEVYAGKQKVWEGITPATLGYVHMNIEKPMAANELTIKMVGPAQNSNRFGQVKELAGGATGELDRVKTAKGKVELRIVEVDLLEKVK